MTDRRRTDGEARRICFMAELQAGVGSVAKTMKPLALGCDNPKVEWVEVTYFDDDGIIERLPLPPLVRAASRCFLQTRAGMRKGPFDALLFLTHNPAVLHPLALRRTPTLLWTDVTPVQLDNWADHYNHPVGDSALGETFKREAVRYAFKAAHRCVAWSEWVRRSLVHDYGVPPERTAVVPPGLDLSLWTPQARSARSAGAPLRLLFVGTDFRRKGGELLLDVFRHSLRGLVEIDVVTREAVTPEPGLRVHHGLTAGSAPLLALYQNADMFVLPTLVDCQPIASLEAMAMGLPVLTTQVGANAEVVDDGRSGWLVPPGDARALAERLSAVARDGAALRTFGETGRQIVRDRFDARQSFDRLVELALESRV